MKIKEYNEDRAWILLALAVFIVLITLMLFAIGIIFFTVRHNDKFVNRIIPKLTYTEENAKTELETVQKMNSIILLSSKAKGAINKAATEISYMTGNDMLYNHFYAQALYYLKKTNNKDDYIYMTNKYIGRLYANGCYQSARVVLSQLICNYNIKDFSLENQASYYLSNADITQMIGENSAYFLYTSNRIISLMPDNSNKKLMQAKLNILEARQSIIDGDFERAEIIMSQYSENDDFGLGENQVYVVCDFKIPYYEIMAKLKMNRNEYEQAYHFTDLYLSNCDDYEFRAMKLNLLQYIVSKIQNTSNDNYNKYSELEKTVSTENLEVMTDEYGTFLLSDIESTTNTLFSQEEEIDRFIFNLILGIIIVYLLFLGYCFMRIFINHIVKDALTQLDNRKKYETLRSLCEKKHIPYSLLMMDIDDFKKVNDTFGHAQGDIILKSISKILRLYCGRGISAYRYGGEELCMVMLNVSEERARSIAEEIRISVENKAGSDECPISVSIGVGISHNGENVFQEADKNLYKAKNNGKNQVV